MINRESNVLRFIACFLAVNILAELVSPTCAYALTSGPSQPEVQGFEPATTTQMVDPFTGDFTYNIPLFELPGPSGGYPFNLSYHSGITMDQEASWVGLGWNINPGAINRQKRGLPDEFKGDEIKVKQDIKDMHHYGVNAGGTVELFGGDLLKGNMGMSMYYNNYRGFGYSMSAGPTFSNPDGKTGVSGGIGLSYDSQNGIGGKLSLGYEQARADLGFNSENGLEGTFGMRSSAASILGSPTNTYTPSVGMEYNTIPLSVSLRAGAGVGGWVAGYVGGFYNVQKLKQNEYDQKGYGYFYLEDEGKNDKSLLDFNRERQTLIHKKTPNLPVPVLTADFYSISGQGVGGMFRAWRSDYGSVYDPSAKSSMNGGSIGVDVGVPHFGLAGTYTHGTSRSGKWEDQNPLADRYDYSRTRTGYYEPAYFRVYGEHSALTVAPENGGEVAIRPQLDGHGTKSTAYVDENNKKQNRLPPNVPQVSNGDRQIRGQNIEHIPNEWLLKGTTEVLPEYGISYFSSQNAEDYRLDANKTKLVRSGSKYKPHHFAGMTVVKEDGNRYVYGLPAINKKEVAAVFSVDNGSTTCSSRTSFATNGNEPNYKVTGTDEYLHRTETPPYAYSYLLTSVLGPDYVDVNDNGPDEADYGYWVKFTYTRAHNAFKWRNPYTNAAFMMGAKSKFSDNKGSYTYGEKEVWYLATAETKSHVAVFNLDPSGRSDAKGAAGEFAATVGTQQLFNLSKVQLYTRPEYRKAQDGSDFADATPVQTIQFEYDNSLCPAVENGSSGKLTLKKVGFYYQNNKRGLLNRYEFTYGGDNPSYSAEKYDRWGNYSNNSSQCHMELPYVQQFSTALNQDTLDKRSFQQTRDMSASAWHLTEIKTPTGSSISIDYEADDYAYVQHREATQMFFIDELETSATKIYNKGDLASHEDGKIYFKLEDPIPVNQPNPDQVIYRKYLKGLERQSGNSSNVQIYFKTYVNFRDNLWDYVSGYSNLKSGGYGVATHKTAAINIYGDGSNQAVTCYTHGYIELEPYEDSRSNRSYNPMAALAWQKMQTDHPELLVAGGGANAQPGTSDYDKAMKVKSLVNLIPQIAKMLKGYLKHCHDRGWAQTIDPSKSVIKLCSPDQKKYGGGVRVKSIVTSDGFSVDGETDMYGHIYDYSMLNQRGEKISSGVASYEPMVGGDENPLRYAKTFTDKQAFKSNNNLYFEYPINESYYPAPSVGYSKVTVRSLATDNVLKGDLSSETGITGEVVHEFYTAKDFPTMASETSIAKNPYNLWVPIPMIGLVSNDKLTAAQGYVVEVNDMHGKPRAVSYSGAADGKVVHDFPVSRVAYEYKSRKKTYDGKTVNAVESEAILPLLLSVDGAKYEMGTHHEFFTDHLSSSSFQVTGGADGNLEIPMFPLVYIWPSYSQSKTLLQTIVFNKAIHRSGVLHKTIATDGQSTVVTENIAFDPFTGTPIVTKSTNNFDQDVYTATSGIASDYVSGAGVDATFPGFIDGAVGPARPSFNTYGYGANFALQQLDTNRYGPSGYDPQLGNGWHSLDKFYPVLNSNYSNFYYMGAQRRDYLPGTILIFRDISTNAVLGRGTVVTFGWEYSYTEDMTHYGSDMCAVYSEDNLPLGTAMQVIVGKPAEKNVLSPKIFKIEAMAYPSMRGPDSLANFNVPHNYIDSVVNTSPVIRYGEAKEYDEPMAANPYRSGELGIALPYQTYSYKAIRKAHPLVDLASDGIYQDGQGGYRFYPLSSLFRYKNSISNHPYWKLTEEVTKYDQYSHAVESRNAIGVYSSMAYSHQGMTVNCEAVNAKSNEIFFIGYEDEDHEFEEISGSLVSSNTSEGHTGSSCLEVEQVTEYKVPVVPADEGKSYFISAWVKAEGEETYDYAASADIGSRGIKVKFYNNDYSVSRGQTDLLEPAGPIIEGWQKIEGVFVINSSTADPVEAIAVEIKPGMISGTITSLKMDDLRVMPHDANLKSYVYDPTTYRLEATLDENNYASLYYYDEEGKLFLVKKETDKGIYTLEESRSHQ